MFRLHTTDGQARTGVLKTAHGVLETPFYMPVLTKGCAKHVSHDELYAAGTQCAIANAFLLYLKPGVETIQKQGGLHSFINWKKALFTDSGGFQMLSEDFLLEITEKGVMFKSPFDGSKHVATPEKIMHVEEELGADVAMALDDVPRYGNAREYIAASMKRTHVWAERCLQAHSRKKQLLFGICQGGTFSDLREESARFFAQKPFDGFALGGLCIGEDKQAMLQMIDSTNKHLPAEKPRYLMGVGSPQDMIEAIARGVDIFDSVFPTQNARHGGLFTKHGRIDLLKVQYAHDTKPIDETCTCYACKEFTRSYMHHLLRVKEPFGLRLATIHNVTFIHRLMKDARDAILQNGFEEFRKEFLSGYNRPVDKL